MHACTKTADTCRVRTISTGRAYNTMLKIHRDTKISLKAPMGVCSIFLRVNRSINKIFKPRVLFKKKSFTKSMYLFITDIFYVHSFAAKLLKSF